MLNVTYFVHYVDLYSFLTVELEIMQRNYSDGIVARTLRTSKWSQSTSSIAKLPCADRVQDLDGIIPWGCSYNSPYLHEQKHSPSSIELIEKIITLKRTIKLLHKLLFKIQ